MAHGSSELRGHCAGLVCCCLPVALSLSECDYTWRFRNEKKHRSGAAVVKLEGPGPAGPRRGVGRLQP